MIIIFLAASGILGVSALMLVVLWIILRAGKVPEDFTLLFSPSRMGLIRKISMWLNIPAGALLAAGLLLSILKPGLIHLLTGIILIGFSVCMFLVILVLTEFSRKLKINRKVQ